VTASTADGQGWPDVAVVMPVRDEAAGLAEAVGSAVAQQYAGRLEVWVAVAPSTDGTEDVASDLAALDPRVHVVANPAGSTPAGLNAAIRASTAPVVIRVDGHSRLPAGYVARAVDTLRRTGAANVGGVQRAVGSTPFESAVAAAMTSRFGVGDADFHRGGAAGPTDTVYLGTFDRDAIEGVGLFDEQLERNQDYELNIRLRRAGGTVWFDPDLEVVYRPRPSRRALARQYFDYGRWKRIVARRHRGSLRWRQIVPPATVVALAVGSTLAVRWRPAAIVPATYAAATVAASVAAGGRRPATTVRLATIFPVMHLAWGLGFLAGRPSFRARNRRLLGELSEPAFGPR